MPFRVEDFHDLIRLLEAQPEWRAELRRLLLTDALLALPEQFAELRADTDRRFQELIAAQQRTETQLVALTQRVTSLADAQQRTETQLAALTQRVTSLADAQQRTETQLAALTQRVTSLADAQQRTETQLAALTQRVTSLADAQQRTETQLASLAKAHQDLETQVAALTGIVHTLVDDVGELKGDSLERRYRERAVAYFGRLLRRVRVLSLEELSALLDEAVARGALSDAEAEAVTWADLVVQGRRREDGAEVALLVEVSWGVGPHDVERAAERAMLLTRAGLSVLPVVAGRVITSEAIEMARRRQVWQMLDGQVMSPSSTSA